MEGKVVTGILAAAGIALLGASVFMIAGQDRTPPVITVGDNELTYTEGESYEVLLVDVTAEDNKDKDISDKVFVDRIIAAKDSKQAVVIYGVMDSSRNVATTRRMVNYAGTKEGVPTDGEVKNEPQEESGAEDKNKQEETPKEQEPVQEPAQEPEKQEDKGELVPNGNSPAIRLKANSATIKAGGAFDALSYVENVVDDKDSRDTLYKHIHIDGKYNTKAVGTYTMRYYATDSNGNASNVETFTLTVE